MSEANCLAVSLHSHLNLTTDSTIQKRDASHNVRRRRGSLVKVAQKVAIVTGGGNGIGGAIAERLATN
ncbi:hypothetical protein CBI38_10475 [Rhodococcus oxybenzonivorans]|uniref:Uncharacterized protein n=1 Tax=Rhodococcus oxybenzonivorans TaxID=1990687 RepID=A0A2S2BTP4_9NOCA|nr:hypothetical protein CBI38_10475 [Rhodococcus oxybenzonivorans]